MAFDMETQGNINTEPPLCAKGCGFFGSVQNMNMCSKCYKDFLKEEELAKPAAVAVASRVDKPLEATNSAAAEVSSAPQKNPKRTRCESCNKKVGPLGFECRCGGLYCGKHRYPQEHSCSIDYKKSGRELLTKQNPVIKGDKMESRI